LTEIYGSGWSDRSLLHCIRIAYTFTEDEIVYAARTQFSWTHIRSLSALTDPLARQFYMEIDGKSLEEVLERSYIITLN
jgi:Protein of unknown function (DUF1016).